MTRIAGERRRFYQLTLPVTGAIGGFLLGLVTTQLLAVAIVGAILLGAFCAYRAPCRIDLLDDSIRFRYGPFGIHDAAIPRTTLRLKSGISLVSFLRSDDQRIGLFKSFWYLKQPLLPNEPIVQSLEMHYPGPGDTL